MHCQSLHRDCKHSHVHLDWRSYYSYADPVLCRIPKADVLSGRPQKRQKVPSAVSHFNPLHLHPLSKSASGTPLHDFVSASVVPGSFHVFRAVMQD